jgi:sugar/nucleoside kinase (ribokinase family)
MTSQPRTGLIASGHWVLDHVKLIDAWPPEEALATITGESFGNGGGAYNVAKNLARLGARFPLRGIGLIGDDDAGERILADCRAHHIDTTQLRVTRDAPTSYTDVMTVRSTGRRTFFTQPGANALLAPEHFNFDGTSARIFYLGYLLLLARLDRLHEGRPAAYEVFARAREAGLLTALDMVSETSDRFTTTVAPVLPLVDVAFANDFEAEQLTGIALRTDGVLDPARVAAAAEKLVALGVQRWVIIHFPEGAHARSRDGVSLWQGAVRVPAASIRGTAGAGDAFSAGVLLGVHEDWSMQESLRLGVCAGAASLRHVTCSDAVESQEACLALGAEFGFTRLSS